MPDDGAGAFSAAANNEKHVENGHSNGSYATADECHANNVSTIIEHGGSKATTNNVRNAT